MKDLKKKLFDTLLTVLPQPEPIENETTETIFVEKLFEKMKFLGEEKLLNFVKLHLKRFAYEHPEEIAKMLSSMLDLLFDYYVEKSVEVQELKAISGQVANSVNAKQKRSENPTPPS